MSARQKDYTSPIYLSLLHLLPSLVLLSLVVIGILSLRSGEQKAVLGTQTALPQIKTETVENRLNELGGLEGIKSEAMDRAKKELSN